MDDMSETVVPKSDQLNADDLIAGPMTIKINRVVVKKGEPQQPVSIFYDGDEKHPYKPSLGMRRALMLAWGKSSSEYVGKSLTLFNEKTIKFGKSETGGIRISHMSHVDKPVRFALTISRGQRIPYTIKVLEVAVPADMTEQAHKCIVALNEKGFELDDDQMKSILEANSKAELAGIFNAIVKVNTVSDEEQS